MSATEERDWWGTLDDDAAVANTAGVPAYDVNDAAEMLTEVVRDYSKPPMRAVAGEPVLDLGCGLGRLTAAVSGRLDDYNFRSVVVGVDIAPRMVEEAARTNYGQLYLVGDGRTLHQFASGQFSLVYSVTVFQHIPHDAKVDYLNEIHRVLSDDGRLIFTWSEGDTEQFLCHQWTEAEMREAVEGAGFEIFEDAPTTGVVDGWRWTYARKVAK